MHRGRRSAMKYIYYLTNPYKSTFRCNVLSYARIQSAYLAVGHEIHILPRKSLQILTNPFTSTFPFIFLSYPRFQSAYLAVGHEIYILPRKSLQILTNPYKSLHIFISLILIHVSNPHTSRSAIVLRSRSLGTSPTMPPCACVCVCV